MASFAEMHERALQVRRMYAEWETTRYGREWTAEELALGFVGDVGDLVKLVQGKAGVRPREDLDEALAHELADCLWCVMVLAEKYDIDLERAFADVMAGLEQHLRTERSGEPRPHPPVS
ncbi:MazG nucleotide pyrophosphohydrolase domain-containing protein [Branchiibius cervicis]|uniref:MazG nucleotide pyrophosphohydrolase domain-containing protein n=1 Tax=Branchiibius cervicis TaxID=908252 RepID=A0ABW2AQH7_9MICO